MLLAALAVLATRVGGARRGAVVTLVTSDDGYISGALALGQSIEAVGSKLHRIAMVTSEVSVEMREVLSAFWEVIEVEAIACNHKMAAAITSDRFDLSSPRYVSGIAKWKHTCTKFAAFTLVAFDRVVFMDADTLVIGPIDDVLYDYSNATLAAAPETFPPDTFNSGFLVLTPGMDTLRRLLEANNVVGSAEGGDQGVLNNGFCKHWFRAAPNDPDCGRLPWIFNVNAASYAPYKALLEMQGMRPISVLHYVSSNKPWKHVSAEMAGIQLPDVLRRELENQGAAQNLWRAAYAQAKKARVVLQTRGPHA
jgi:lipopolysaccharide biosynthesis glycosyltransferase